MKVWAERLLLMGIGLFGALSIAEGVARVRESKPPPQPRDHQPAPDGMFVADDDTGFRLAPSFTWDDEKFGTNVLGLRDAARVVGPAKEGVTRVAVVGDSFTAGVGVEDHQTFTRLLDAAGGEALDVWNLGVPHYGTEQSFAHLRSRWEQVQPDVVVLALFEGNDAWDDAQGPSRHQVIDGQMRRASWRPWKDSPYKTERAAINEAQLGLKVPGSTALTRWSATFRLLNRAVEGSKREQARPEDLGPLLPFDYERFGGVAWLYLKPAPPPVETAWGISGDVVQQMKGWVEARGAKLAVLSLPARVTADPAELGDGRAGWMMGPPQGYELDLEAAHGRSRAIAEAAGVPWFDTLSALQLEANREPAYYRDDSHFTAAGHRATAVVLGAGLAEAGLIPPMDRGALKAAVEELVPPRSTPVLFSGGFRPRLQRIDPRGKKGPKGKGGKDDPYAPPDPKAAGKGKGGSELAPRLIDPQRLAALLPQIDGWTRGEVIAEIGPLPPPREDVLVARAVAEYVGPDGPRRLEIWDTANQPELDQHLRSRRDARMPTVAPGLLPSTARFAAIGDQALRGGIDAAAFDALEAEFAGGAEPRRNDEVRVPLPDGTPGPPGPLAGNLVDPEVLVSAMPAPPEGWEALELTPVYRNHPVSTVVLPAEVENVLGGANLIRPPVDPWSVQIKEWFRGPAGSFALVVQDTGLDERLIRSREDRIARAPDGSREPGIELKPWSGAGLVGFRTCKEDQGLCKVVAPLCAADDPQRAACRFNAILMGPPAAADADFEAVIAGIRRDSLPR